MKKELLPLVMFIGAIIYGTLMISFFSDIVSFNSFKNLITFVAGIISAWAFAYFATKFLRYFK